MKATGSGNETGKFEAGKTAVSCGWPDTQANTKVNIN